MPKIDGLFLAVRMLLFITNIARKLLGWEHFKAVGMIHTVTLVVGKTFTFLVHVHPWLSSII